MEQKSRSLLKKQFFSFMGGKQQFLIFLYVDKFIFACCFPAAPFLSNFLFYLFSFYFFNFIFFTSLPPKWLEMSLNKAGKNIVQNSKKGRLLS